MKVEIDRLFEKIQNLVSGSREKLGMLIISRVKTLKRLAKVSKPLTLFSPIRHWQRTMSAFQTKFNRATFDCHICIIKGNVYK